MEKNILPIVTTKEIISSTNVNSNLLGKFENSLLIIKLLMFLILIIASILNQDLTFGAGNVLTDNRFIVRFIIETIVVGFGCAIPILYMKYMRDYNNASFWNMSILFIFSFFFMGLVNVLFQFSGFYSFMFGINSVPKAQQSLKKGLISSVLLSNLIIVGLLIIQVLIISFMIGNTDIPAYSNNVILWFIIELLIFALGNSLPSLLVTFNRIGNLNISSLYTTMMSIIGFSVLHGVFQISGFYKHILGI
jgi:hypothetical protein